MKKIISLFAILTITVSLFAQMPVITSKIKNLGVSSPGVIVQINPSLADTFGYGDTLFYKVAFNHDAAGFPYISLLHKKLGTRDTTATISYYQSVNGVNWQPLKKGKALSTYTTSIDTTSISNATYSSNNRDISFLRDTCYYESQYVGIRIIVNGPSTGSKKTYYRPRYYGSIRLNIWR